MEMQIQLTDDQVSAVAIAEVGRCLQFAQIGGDKEAIKAFETVMEMLEITRKAKADGTFLQG